jgi:chemotaxis protein MotB
MNEGAPVIIKKKKGHGEHAHHGGSWKVAYADFVTAMMAFFMVMWIMGLSDATRTQVQGYFNDPMGFAKSQPLSKNLINFKNMSPPKAGVNKPAGSVTETLKDEKELEKTEKQVQEALMSDPELKGLFKNIETDITEEGLRIEFVETAGAVFFESGGAVVRPAATKVVRTLAPVLANSRRSIIIEGHTDARPYQGSGYDNWDLSTDRAAALRRLLVNLGVHKDQILQVRGYAATKLRVVEDPYHFANRRVTILLPYKPVNDELHDLPANMLREEVQAAIHPDVFSGSSQSTESTPPSRH